MQLHRLETRRACPARRDRVSPARVAAPIAAAFVVIGGTAFATVSVGLPVTTVAIVTALVAIVGGCVAHRTVRNLTAGLVLLLVRPYGPGEKLRLRLPEPIGVVDAELVRIGFGNTTLCTEHGLVTVPNARLLARDAG